MDHVQINSQMKSQEHNIKQNNSQFNISPLSIEFINGNERKRYNNHT